MVKISAGNSHSLMSSSIMRLILPSCFTFKIRLIGGLFAGLLFIATGPLQAPSTAAEVPSNSATGDGKDPLPLQDLRLFTLIFDHIRRSYVEPVSDQQLLENAIKGMLQELDPHSIYLDADAFAALQENTKGEFSGVGLEIGSEDGYIKVITPIDDSPAARAGLRAGDLIIKLDNESIRGFSLSEAADRLRGPQGSAVTLTVIRSGEDKPIDITVVRGTIKSRSVRSRLMEEDFGYLRIAQFQADTGEDFVAAIKQLRTDNPGLKGLVMDLRNNPGGILQASIEVVDALIDEGLVVYTEGRRANSGQSFSATPGDIAQGLPLVVLVNGGSASAAEIVAGALQDHQRAIIMGTASFGKGSVQTILPVGEDKGIKLTTALYFTPKGRSIQAQGIIPDVEVKPATITELDESHRFKEVNLSGHLSNNAPSGDNDEAQPGAGGREGAPADGNNRVADNQLFEAINMLKGLSIYNRANFNRGSRP